MGSAYFNTGPMTGSYFLFEAAFASVTFALVSVIALRKVKMKALALFSIAYFTLYRICLQRGYGTPQDGFIYWR
ncbi:MAG: hypothetical protein QW194_02515 [Candidatus Micrarchaeaceae archaeon]